MRVASNAVCCEDISRSHICVGAYFASSTFLRSLSASRGARFRVETSTTPDRCITWEYQAGAASVQLISSLRGTLAESGSSRIFPSQFRCDATPSFINYSAGRSTLWMSYTQVASGQWLVCRPVVSTANECEWTSQEGRVTLVCSVLQTSSRRFIS